jgi:hypothetical protein
LWGILRSLPKLDESFGFLSGRFGCFNALDSVWIMFGLSLVPLDKSFGLFLDTVDSLEPWN